MDYQALSHVADALGAAFSVAVGSGLAAIGQSIVIGKSMDAMARQPEMAKDIKFVMIIGLAMVESLAIYCLLVSLILLFVKW